ncbi:MAG: hypothetical protein SNJ82_11120 [Gemmataceae bacterium]
MVRGSLAAVLLLLLLVGCQGRPTRSNTVPAELPDLRPVVIDYVDTDGFDAVLEAALVDQAPIIIIQTTHRLPTWEGRLNAWIAAWNRTGRSRSKTVRGQLPLTKLPLDADSLSELRKLVEGLLDRVEAAAERNATWWANERERSRRIGLMKSYNLRFHRDGEGPICIILFHGSYAAYYPQFMRQLMQEPEMPDETWSRTVECSRCERTDQAAGVNRLVKRWKTTGN